MESMFFISMERLHLALLAQFARKESAATVMKRQTGNSKARGGKVGRRKFQLLKELLAIKTLFLTSTRKSGRKGSC